jgi:phosphate transport system substrate-binding protein
MKLRFLLVVKFIICFILLCISIGYAETLYVAGGAAPVENILKPIKFPFEEKTGIKLIIIPSGPVNAFKALESGEVEAAAAGLTFDQWVDLLKKNNLEVKNPESYKKFHLGKDRIVVLLNKENLVNKLSKEQIKGIFTGKIRNWQEVGGKDSPILIVWGRLIPGTNKLFTEFFLDNEKVNGDIMEVNTVEEIKETITNFPEAIGISSWGAVDERLKVPQIPELIRDITLITKGEPTERVKKLIDFIYNEGARYTKTYKK